MLDQFFKSFDDELDILVEENQESMLPYFGDSAPAYRKRIKEIREWKCEVEELEKLQGYCSYLTPSNVPAKYRVLHSCLIQGVRLVGMLHDVGHPPFSHVCEKALTDLYQEVSKTPKSDRNEAEAEFIETIDKIKNDEELCDIELHEEISKSMLKIIFSGVRKEVSGEKDLHAQYTLIGIITEAIYLDKGIFSDLHQIISGTFDSDRLDYIKRDSISSGFGTDVVQYSRIFEGVKIDTRESQKEDIQEYYIFTYPVKTLPSIELFLKKRFDNYKTIIFHHRVVKSGVLVKEIVSRLARKHLGENKTVNRDEIGLPLDISGLWSPLIMMGEGSKVSMLSFSQWNDTWLITTMMREYIELEKKAEEEELDEDELLIKDQLGELLYSQKAYYSIIKRGVDCAIFRETFIDGFKSQVDLSKKITNMCPKGEQEREEVISAGPTVKLFESLIELNANIHVNPVSIISENFAIMFPEGIVWDESTYSSFNLLIKAMVATFLRNNGVEPRDVLVQSNGIKEGISRRVFLATERDNEVKSFSKISNLAKALKVEKGMMPSLYIFINANEELSNIVELRSNLTEYLAKKLFELTADRIEKLSDTIDMAN